MADVVTVSQAQFRWPGRDGFALAVDRFELEAGRTTLLLGPSGGGKSTFLAMLSGIVAAQQGSVAVLGTDLAQLKPAARDAFRAEHIGVIFQMFNLLPYGSVLDNVRLPLAFAPRRRARANTQGGELREAQRLLERLGIDARLAARPASALSVGQQQRVAAARALIGSPEIVLADEPTSALDENARDRFLALLFAQVKDSGATLLMVSHDRGLGSRFDRVVRLDQIAHFGPGGSGVDGREASP